MADFADKDFIQRAESFFQTHQKNLTISATILLVVVGGWVGYNHFYLPQQEVKAQSEIPYAQGYFEKDSFQLALEGDGMNPGFLSIAKKYSGTRAANLSNYYAGISYLQLKNYEDAIRYLKKFSLKDPIFTPLAIGAIGDASIELDRIDEGINQYLKAAKKYPNSFTTPLFLFKAGMALEAQGKPEKAKPLYQEIKDKYADSNFGREIDKHLARVGG